MSREGCRAGRCLTLGCCWAVGRTSRGRRHDCICDSAREPRGCGSKARARTGQWCYRAQGQSRRASGELTARSREWRRTGQRVRRRLQVLRLGLWQLIQNGERRAGLGDRGGETESRGKGLPGGLRRCRRRDSDRVGFVVPEVESGIKWGRFVACHGPRGSGVFFSRDGGGREEKGHGNRRSRDDGTHERYLFNRCVRANDAYFSSQANTTATRVWTRHGNCPSIHHLHSRLCRRWSRLKMPSSPSIVPSSPTVAWGACWDSGSGENSHRPMRGVSATILRRSAGTSLPPGRAGGSRSCHGTHWTWSVIICWPELVRSLLTSHPSVCALPSTPSPSASGFSRPRNATGRRPWGNGHGKTRQRQPAHNPPTLFPSADPFKQHSRQ
ncbi:hypothetical protein QBC39DRAFT_41269 [Podospora conica]|nr:hypothetical protein QBC39DRAFT_41269 [Schizothecium conicum]